MVGVEALSPLSFILILCYRAPKAPRWLLTKNRTEEANKNTWYSINPDSVLGRLEAEHSLWRRVDYDSENIFMPEISCPIDIGFSLSPF